MPDMKITEEHAKLSWIWLAFIVLVLDQITKYWVMNNFQFQEVRRILPVLNFTMVYNRGASFSFMQSMPTTAFWLFSTVAIVLCTGLILWMYRLPKTNTWLSISLALILGGALGNLLDRLRYGFVIDFISFHYQQWYFAVFNLADVAICTGAAMVVANIYWSTNKGS